MTDTLSPAALAAAREFIRLWHLPQRVTNNLARALDAFAREAVERERRRLNDAEGILVCAVRYCIGRRSYIVGSCDRWVRQLWSTLSPGTRKTIIDDIYAALERDRLGHASIGMDMDRDTWAALYRDLKDAERPAETPR